VKPPSPAELQGLLHGFGLARDRLLIGLARRTRLSQLDLHTLEHLEAAGALTPRELERRLGLTSGAVTALIDRLERVGWVRRAPNPADRRSVLVELSATAQATAAEQLDDYHRQVRRTIERLSPADRAAIGSFLGKITEAARRHGDLLWADTGDERT
jgi:DNA-binding MarR family transcriptional regulator